MLNHKTTSSRLLEALEDRRLLSAGDLDPTFGTGGKWLATPDTAPGFLLPADLAVQSDGKLLFAGIGLTDVGTVVRLNANGTLDSSFGDNGVAKSGFGPYLSNPSALAVGPLGKIAVAGAAGPFQQEIPYQATLVIYNSNGQLDTSFDHDGIVNAPQFPRGFTDVAYQSDGKILALGEKLARYNADGTLDKTFGGGDGIADVSGKKILIDSAGNIDVLGYFALFRFTPSGLPDTSFDGDGVVPSVKGSDFALAPDGDLVVVGNGPTASLVTRFNSNGSIDKTFGVNGNVTAFAGMRIAITDSDIYIGGTANDTNIPHEQFEFRAFTQSGALDTSFANGGHLLSSLSLTSSGLIDLGIQSGKLIALGAVEINSFLPNAVTVPGIARYQTAPVANAQQPFSGTPISIPNLIEAENFDTGGEGVAYHDADLDNIAGATRLSEAVDIQNTPDAGGGYTVGFVHAGEWLEYTVNVPVAGVFDISFRVSHLKAGGKFHLESDGVNITGALAVPKTGDWNTYTTIAKTGVALSAGQHVLRLAFDANGDLGYVGNFNWIKISAPTQSAQQPFEGAPYTDTQRVQSENFDKGGENTAYHDTETANLGGGAYRTAEGVDIQPTTDTGGGLNVGFIRPGEWLEYTMNFTQAGPFNLDLRVASQGPSGNFRVLVDGQSIGTFNTTDTGGWQSWKTLTKTGIQIASGQHTIRFQADTANPTQFTINLNWFQFTHA
jgi:uncharacterized delta-60 repeat protein